jgi:hypothetical protein
MGFPDSGGTARIRTARGPAISVALGAGLAAGLVLLLAAWAAPVAGDAAVSATPAPSAGGDVGAHVIVRPTDLGPTLHVTTEPVPATTQAPTTGPTTTYTGAVVVPTTTAGDGGAGPAGSTQPPGTGMPVTGDEVWRPVALSALALATGLIVLRWARRRRARDW